LPDVEIPDALEGFKTDVPSWQSPWHQLETCTGLSLEERAAYLTITDIARERDGIPLPWDAFWIAGRLGCSARKAKSLINSLVDKRRVEVVPDYGPTEPYGLLPVDKFAAPRS
jgi:hypothetical protein